MSLWGGLRLRLIRPTIVTITGIIMDKPDATCQSRREVLQALATASAAVTAAALPASAQETVRPRASTTGEGTIAQTLADYAVKLRYEDLPTEVVRTVKRTIIDTIGCAIGGYEAGPSQIALKLARALRRADIASELEGDLARAGLVAAD